MKKNIFVIGDLVIDHTIYIKAKPGRPHQAVGGENVYEVIRRQDDAGGAANTARILSVINRGKTFLWGLIGQSNWGNFRSILLDSDRFDETIMPIELRGVKDETEAQMNTITRIIQIDIESSSLMREHKVRFDDYGNFHVTDVKRKSVIYYLHRAKDKYGVDAIIINDLDYGCMTKEIIKDISEYAHSQNPPIPLFIDPKLDKFKYEEIDATAILPNLYEWCHLVGKPETHDQWRQRLDNPADLKKMAELSFSHFKKIKYHIIKCDRDGAVIIAPHTKKRNLYAVYRIPPVETQLPNLPHQLGCGDVMTGVFAFEFSGKEMTSENALKGFFRANTVVKFYREMPWHVMPSLISVKQALKEAETQKIPKHIAEVSMSRLFLPKNERLILSESATNITGLYSQDSAFCETISSLVNDIIKSWGPSSFRSIILAARSGSGKSTISKWILEELPKKHSIHVEDMSKTLTTTFEDGDIDNQLNQLTNRMSDGCKKLLIIVDEALKNNQKRFLSSHGVNLLNAAHDKNIRFLFIDADFKLEDERSILDSQFTSRCRYYRLSGIGNRPVDIPLIIGAHLFELGQRANCTFNCISIEERLLLDLIDKTLSRPNPRVLCDLVGRIFEKVISQQPPTNKMNLTINNSSSKSDKRSKLPNANDTQRVYEFFNL